jgi:hypothetical protein
MPPAARKPTTAPRQRAGRPSKKVTQTPTPTGSITVPNQMLRMPAASEHEVVLADSDVPRFYSTPTEPDDNNPYDEREIVFFYDDKEYDAPKIVPASFGLKFIEMRLMYGIDAAVLYALQVTLGMEGVGVLTSIPKLEPEQLGGIVDRLVMKLVNSTTLPKGG